MVDDQDGRCGIHRLYSDFPTNGAGIIIFSIKFLDKSNQ
jgi:hypothetical protein